MNGFSQESSAARVAMGRRVSVLIGLAVFLFAVLIFRVWFMQVLSGDEYLAEANENRTRAIVASAPRGEIRDRNGEVLVTNRSSLVLQLDPRELAADQERRRRQVGRVAELAEMPVERVRRLMREQIAALPGGMVTVARDVPHDVVFYLAENQAAFPALSVERSFARQYTDVGRGAAHVVGSVGEVNQEELESPRFRDVEPGEVIGKGGVETTYDEYLRGEPGETLIQVDAMGRTIGQLSEVSPVPGGNLRLSLDAELQSAGSTALSNQGLPGGFVVMDVDSGEVLGLGSAPTFDPAVFTRPLTQAMYRSLVSEETNAPLFNRVTQGVYPVGSTFKPVTALAGLAQGVIEPETIIEDGGSITVGDQTFANAQDAAYGPINLIDSLRVSSDVYYYLLGLELNGGLALQNWSERLGFGEATGIDLPDEAEGLVPSPEWRNQLAATSDEVDPWTVGHNIQLAIGQGDFQADPLQMAVAYAAIANGGTVVTPHVGMAVEDTAGRIIREFDPEPRREVEIPEAHQSAIMEGLHQAVQAPGGTAYPVFEDFPVPVAGKTGTAERPPHADQSWFMALGPYPDPEIVVAITFEEGGFGSETAAPAAESILSAYFADEIAAAQESAGEGGVTAEGEG